MKRRSFTQLKKSMSYEQFNKFCKKITEEYATSEAQFARSYYIKQYEISDACYYKIIEYAIVRNLVNDLIVTKAMNKAINNQKTHSTNAGCSTKAKYSKMYTKRCKYIADSYNVEEIKQMAIEYANTPGVSKTDLATSYGITRKVFELLLIRAIVEGIVEDNVVDAMEKRSKENTTNQETKEVEEFFKDLQEKRNKHQNE